MQAEINNIAMYEAFLAQGDVPEDVQAVFNFFIRASQSHLNAFSRGAERFGVDADAVQTYGRGGWQTTDQTMTYGNRMAAANQTYGHPHGGADHHVWPQQCLADRVRPDGRHAPADRDQLPDDGPRQLPVPQYGASRAAELRRPLELIHSDLGSRTQTPCPIRHGVCRLFIVFILGLW